MIPKLPEETLFEDLFFKKEILWKQMAHDDQVLLGNMNTWYFHNKKQVAF